MSVMRRLSYWRRLQGPDTFLVQQTMNGCKELISGTRLVAKSVDYAARANWNQGTAGKHNHRDSWIIGLHRCSHGFTIHAWHFVIGYDDVYVVKGSESYPGPAARCGQYSESQPFEHSAIERQPRLEIVNP